MGTIRLDDQVAEQISSVEDAVENIQNVFKNIESMDYKEITKNMSSIDKAKYDLTNLYAINSLFWMYLRSFGEDPRETAIRDELNRIRKQMMRAKEVDDKSKRPQLDKGAANRFISHELNKNKKLPNPTDENWDEDEVSGTSKNENSDKIDQNSSNLSQEGSRKRKHESDDESSSSEEVSDSSSDDESFEIIETIIQDEDEKKV